MSESKMPTSVYHNAEKTTPTNDEELSFLDYQENVLKTKEEKMMIWKKWFSILIASIPAAVFGILFDDWLDAHLHNYVTVASTLIIYGLAFIAIETILVGKKKKAAK